MLQYSEAIMNLVQRCVTASLAREARRSAPRSSALSALPAWQGNHMRHWYVFKLPTLCLDCIFFGTQSTYLLLGASATIRGS
jgi:hypothetical protein